MWAIVAPSISDFHASPTLVQQNDRSKLFWATTGMKAGACSITANPVTTDFNPYTIPSESETSGNVVSDPLASTTTFTLRCTGMDNQTYSKQATVRVRTIGQI